MRVNANIIHMGEIFTQHAHKQIKCTTANVPLTINKIIEKRVSMKMNLYHIYAYSSILMRS